MKKQSFSRINNQLTDNAASFFHSEAEPSISNEGESHHDESKTNGERGDNVHAHAPAYATADYIERQRQLMQRAREHQAQRAREQLAQRQKELQALPPPILL